LRWSRRTGVLVAVGLLAAIQLWPVDRTNPPVRSDLQAPAAVREVLVRSCFDCHSHQTTWPWYSHVAPLSWWIAGHVASGRADLDFSEWPNFDFAAQDLLLQGIAKQVQSGAMPPRSYVWGHPAARLSDADRQLVLDWAQVSGDAGADPLDGRGF
jgi:hypothetical protein